MAHPWPFAWRYLVLLREDILLQQTVSPLLQGREAGFK